MKQAVGLHWENGAMNPGRLPWAGMNDAFGVSEASPELDRACLEEIPSVAIARLRKLPHLNPPEGQSTFEARLRGFAAGLRNRRSQSTR